MKRATSVILVMSMVFFSAAFLLLPSAALLGDVNGDGFVYADDARQILRRSAQLSVTDPFDPLLADVNRDSYIHADDARLALRMSAKIEETELYEEQSVPDRLQQPVSVALPDFGGKLFGAAYKEGENTLISPLSVYTALAMLSAGADGDTLTQLENTLGTDQQTIKTDISAYAASIKDSKVLKSANSVWVRDDERLKVREVFIKDNSDCFGAEVFIEPFTPDTLSKVNGWVSNKTDDMIPQIINEIKPEDMLYLINALAFDCEWADKYESADVSERVFNSYDGKTQTVSFMRGNESKYIESGNTVGFVKDYKDRRYSFVGLIPTDKDAGLSGFVSALAIDGKLSDLVNSAHFADVDLTFPKFESEYSDSLADELSAMGIKDAFDPVKADLSRMGQYGASEKSLCVSDVLHKSFISVTEDGTRAAAATAVIIVPKSAPPQYRKTLVFDRPFVYMIWDNEYDIPLFIGAVEKL